MPTTPSNSDDTKKKEETSLTSEGGATPPKGSGEGSGSKTNPKPTPEPEPEPETKRFRLKVLKLDSANPSSPDDDTGSDNGGQDEDQAEGEEEEEEETSQVDPQSATVKATNSEAKKSKKGQKSPPATPPNAKPLTVVEYKNITQAAFEKTPLTDVRKKIASVMNEPFRFCDLSGAISQDGKTLSSYLEELKAGEIKPDVPINVYVTSFTRPKTSAVEILDNPPFVLKFVQKLKENETQKESTLQSSSLPNVEGGKIKLKEIRKYVKAMSASSSRHQFCLEDGHTVDDEISLKEYVSSLSTTVDSDGTPQATASIEIYFAKPGAIKKSKRKGASDELKAMPALKLEKEDLKTLEEFNAQRDKELREVKEELDMANFQLEGGEDDAKSAGALTEEEWAMVIRNCNLMYGWVVDSHNNQVIRAAKPAFRLRNGLNMDETPTITESDQAAANTESSEESSANSEKPATPTPRIAAAIKPRGIPHFAVNDNSEIEVTMVSHEFQESMAKAHFSSTSVEAEISGGFGAYSAGVSGSYNQESTTNEKSSKQKNEKIMIGTYRFPRATVHLTPNDLEPTPELEAAIKRIRTRKNVMDLRQLHKDYGHMFCRKVVIGGCLQTTKTITMTTETSEKSARSQYKASVGAAFQTPYVSGSVKASHGEGDASDEGSTKTDTQEKIIFEATGGNTIFASDPKRWTISVTNPKSWRVIEQDGLSSLAGAISEMHGYGDAPMWFMQAVPSLSKYIEIPRSRILNVRFKAMVNEHVRDKLLGADDQKYLGHDSVKILDYVHRPIKVRPGATAPYFPPRHESGKLILDLTAFTELVNVPVEEPLFSPKSVQCPALMSYTGILGLEGAKRIDQSLFAKIEVAKAKVAKAKAAKARYDQLVVAEAERARIELNKSLTAWLQTLDAYIKELTAAKTEADQLKAAQGELETAEKDLNAVKESNAAAIKKFSAEFKNTVWRLEVPDGGVLAHEARVSVRSLAADPNPTLSVYRNAQGVYLPTMSSYDGPCFWRILKTDPFSREGDPIKDGDDIRLCWRFSDQGDGFRDFHDDTFGRRRFTKPSEAGEVLYLKVPYPPIQSASADIALVLSSARTQDPIVEKFKTLPKGSESNYNLHDLSLRIDSAGDNGMGESMDYMAPIVESQKRNQGISWGEDRPQFSDAALIVGSILLPGVNGPVAGSMLRALFL